MNPNLHAQQIPAQTLTEVQRKLTEVTTLLRPYMASLTVADRQVLPKMGEKTLAFVTKAREYAGQQPELLPAYINKADFDIDVADAVNLIALKSQIDQMASLIDDTMLLAGSEAYTASLAFYNSVKQAARQNVPGAKVIHDDLSARFATRSRKVESTQ
ncbi:hypothetical protein LX69_02113 [Breznakibacter xylanolyticus]|uniref:Uncharacterized protein n=1 Tax=Breznakibacter xylanolyticus TaxID=990 RepID=A0A2W7Q283_9BACT|nr:hypothetical protein [Breznakibacter xylanolyticus]PZX15919.1 hypothetical protein LX69_02113 [Breznakibacter xylanolyticus]